MVTQWLTNNPTAPTSARYRQTITKLPAETHSANDDEGGPSPFFSTSASCSESRIPSWTRHFFQTDVGKRPRFAAANNCGSSNQQMISAGTSPRAADGRDARCSVRVAATSARPADVVAPPRSRPYIICRDIDDTPSFRARPCAWLRANVVHSWLPGEDLRDGRGQTTGTETFFGASRHALPAPAVWQCCFRLVGRPCPGPTARPVAKDGAENSKTAEFRALGGGWPVRGLGTKHRGVGVSLLARRHHVDRAWSWRLTQHNGWGSGLEVAWRLYKQATDSSGLVYRWGSASLRLGVRRSTRTQGSGRKETRDRYVTC